MATETEAAAPPLALADAEINWDRLFIYQFVIAELSIVFA